MVALAEKLTAVAGREASRVREISHAAEPLPSPDDPAFGHQFDRFGSARVVLLGEATHGTSEFYQARTQITRRLIEEHGFTIVAAEADWPDAAHIHAYIRGRERPSVPDRPFDRFPTWMWRNDEMRALVDWLAAYNALVTEPERQVGFYGLDLYSLGSSLRVVTNYLAKADPAAADEARRRYACLAPYLDDPEDYGLAALRSGFETCEDEAAAVLRLLGEEATAARGPVEARFDAVRNAHVVSSAGRYYRALSAGAPPSWNLRDQHMFDTLLAVLEARGPDAKAVVWAHNSHVGNAAATEMARRGELNIGELCRRRFGDQARLVGFGTDRGTVIAASRWGGAPEVKTVRPSLEGSYGALFRDAGPDRFLLDLRGGAREDLRQALRPPRLQRAIGVVYLPETERASHYFEASLPEQFDAFVFLEETRAVTPLPETGDKRLPEGHPFAV